MTGHAQRDNKEHEIIEIESDGEGQDDESSPAKENTVRDPSIARMANEEESDGDDVQTTFDFGPIVLVWYEALKVRALNHADFEGAIDGAKRIVASLPADARNDLRWAVDTWRYIGRLYNGHEESYDAAIGDALEALCDGIGGWSIEKYISHAQHMLVLERSSNAEIKALATGWLVMVQESLEAKLKAGEDDI